MRCCGEQECKPRTDRLCKLTQKDCNQNEWFDKAKCKCNCKKPFTGPRCDDTDCKLQPNDCDGDKEVFDKENCRCACKKPFTGKNCDSIICNKSEKDCVIIKKIEHLK